MALCILPNMTLRASPAECRARVFSDGGNIAAHFKFQFFATDTSDEPTYRAIVLGSYRLSDYLTSITDGKKYLLRTYF